MDWSVLEKIKGWEDVGGGATAIGVVIATIAAIFAYGQIVAGKAQAVAARATQREATAYQAYNNYLQLAIQFPHLAAGGLSKGDASFEAYAWFVSYFLNACEQILDVRHNDGLWIEAMKVELNYHKQYLAGDDEFRREEKPYYVQKLRDLIDEVGGKTRTTP